MATAVRRRSPRLLNCSPTDTTSSPYFPPELIPEVARRLTSLQDFFALRAAYRAVLPLTPSNLASQAPLRLLLPYRAARPAALFDFSLRRLLRFRLPNTRKGSRSGFICFGCRVAIYDYYTSRVYRELRIVHLLTGEQTHLPSPMGVFSDVVLSGDLIFTWIFLDRTIQYCRVDAAGWRVVSISEPYHLWRLICIGGTVYVLVTPSPVFENPVYHLATVELSDNSDLAELAVLGGAFDARTLHLPDGTELNLYLAELCGELILVNAVGFDDARVYHVFQWKSGEAKWVRITSLGGCTLFFSGMDFQGCLGPDHLGVRKDRMYFNNEGFWTEYSFVDGSFQRSDMVNPGGKIDKDFGASGWLFPSMC